MLVSKVAQFRAEIDREYEAMKQGLTGIASVGRHDIIEKRFNTFYDTVSVRLQNADIPESDILATMADYYGQAADDIRSSQVAKVETL